MCRITGNALVMPSPPRMVRASRAIASASRTLFSLPTLICVGVSRPASLSRPRCSASSIPFSYSTSMFASFSWMSWVAPIGRPNTSRVVARPIETSRQSRAAPIAPQTMP